MGRNILDDLLPSVLLSTVSILNPIPAGDDALQPLPDGLTASVLRSILFSIEDGVLLTDLEHRSLACNRRFGEIFAIDPDEALQIGVEELRARVEPLIVDAPRWRRTLAEVYGDPTRRFEDEITLSRHGEMVLRRISTPVYDAGGVLNGRLWTFSDVTEIRQRRRNADLLAHDLDDGASRSRSEPQSDLRGVDRALRRGFPDQYRRRRLSALPRQRGRPRACPRASGYSQDARTYCGYTLLDDRALLVQDAMKNSRFSGLLPASAGFCRYLGVPVRDETGRAIGTVCITDQKMDVPLTESDIELMELVAMRANAEIARERHLAERMAEKDRQFAQGRAELEETRVVLQTMNDVLSLLFEVRDTPELLRRQVASLRDVLGYTAPAVFFRPPGGSLYEVAYHAHGGAMPSFLSANLTDDALLEECSAEGSASDVRFVEIAGTSLATLLGVPWVAVSCLPTGEWGDAVVVLGRRSAPPEASARHAVQLTAVVDSVRLVLAAHALNAGIVRANLALVDAQEKALRSEKLAVVGTLAASTAHDIRNITASLSMLAMETGNPERSLTAIREQLDRFNVLAHRLLSYARPGQTQSHPVDLPELLARVLDLTSGQMRVSRVEASLKCSADLPYPLGDAHQLQHLFVNLALNAVQAMERTGGRLRIEARRAEDRAEVRITDDGPGIPESVAARLFQPFASSRAQGFGLGLFSAKRIVEAHGGTIAALANPEGGTTFLVTLPLDEGAR